MEPAVPLEALHGRNGSVGRFSNGGDAGRPRRFSDQHHARAALPFSAAVFAPRQAELLAEHGEQRTFRIHVDLVGRPVNEQLQASHASTSGFDRDDIRYRDGSTKTRAVGPATQESSYRTFRKQSSCRTSRKQTSCRTSRNTGRAGRRVMQRFCVIGRIDETGNALVHPFANSLTYEGRRIALRATNGGRCEQPTTDAASSPRLTLRDQLELAARVAYESRSAQPRTAG